MFQFVCKHYVPSVFRVFEGLILLSHGGLIPATFWFYGLKGTKVHSFRRWNGLETCHCSNYYDQIQCSLTWRCLKMVDVMSPHKAPYLPVGFRVALPFCAPPPQLWDPLIPQQTPVRKLCWDVVPELLAFIVRECMIDWSSAKSQKLSNIAKNLWILHSILWPSHDFSCFHVFSRIASSPCCNFLAQKPKVPLPWCWPLPYLPTQDQKVGYVFLGSQLPTKPCLEWNRHRPLDQRALENGPSRSKNWLTEICWNTKKMFFTNECSNVFDFAVCCEDDPRKVWVTN